MSTDNISEGSQSLTGYIEGDYLQLRYGDYKGTLDISDDAKYYAENYETMISWYNDTWNPVDVSGKIILKFRVSGILKDVELCKSIDCNQILIEQQNEMRKMQKRITKLEKQVNELSKPAESKVKLIRIRIEDTTSTNPCVNDFLKNRQLLVKSYETIRDKLEILVYTLGDNKYHKLSMGFSDKKQAVKSCGNITLDYRYTYLRSTSNSDYSYYVIFTEHYVKGDNWSIIECSKI